jgi:hypothetical protein
MNYSYLPLLTAFCAALVGGYFSFVSLINSKEQKTSEFRQAWIDSLRKEISEFLSCVYFFQFYYQQIYENKQEIEKDKDTVLKKEAELNTKFEFINGLKETHQKYNISNSAIRLRINHQETKKIPKELNDKFISTLDEICQAVNQSRYSDAGGAGDRLIVAAQPLLKIEWERVKKGEKSYQWIKNGSIGVFLLALIIIIFLLNRPIIKDDEISLKKSFNSNLSDKSGNLSETPSISQTCNLFFNEAKTKIEKSLGSSSPSRKITRCPP